MNKELRHEFRVKLLNARRNELILSAFDDDNEPFADSPLYKQVTRPQFLFGIKVIIKSIERDLGING